VLAGPIAALQDIETRFDAQDIAYRRLHTSHAFHSAMMDPMIRPLADDAQRIALAAPQVPLVSCVTGDWLRPDEAMSPEYWARHAREPVRFAAGIATLTAAASPLLLEVGPGSTLTTLAAQTSRASIGRAFASLPDAAAQAADDESVLATLGKLWVNGVNPDWRAVAEGPRRRVPLPTYPFERHRYWIEPPARASETASNEPQMTLTTIAEQSDALRATILDVLEDVSGESAASAPGSATFLELGFDSLSLSQVAQRLQARLKVKIAFRQLLGELSTIDALEGFIRQQVPAPAPMPAAAAPVPPVAAGAGGESVSAVAGLMRAQVDAMADLIRKQIDTLQRMGAQTAEAAPAPAPQAVPAAEETPSRFRAYRPVQKRTDSALTPAQQRHIDALTARLTAKTAGSKRMTAQYRPVLADPRACAGFRPEWKELVYPIVAVRAHQSRIRDIDGNDYIDLVSGYGPTAFGHSPDFVVEAVREQLDKGFAIGPQAEYAGEIAALFTEMTGNERMTFCNTGSEAVMAAMRVARTVTGRSKVVLFSGGYHGQFDEVLVRGLKRSGGAPRAMPIAAGIPDSAVENVIVLDYATPESLQWIRDNGDDLAAVVVEPVQSRHPDLQPFDFLRSLRAITEAAGIVFVMDEIVTGFRVHPGGMQAITGIRADLATYGKVIGGGLPIGILAGRAKFMDALDGGAWNYGDDSVPEVGVTFFAGTFVRHPLTLAAVRAVLLHLKSHGPALQEQVARRAAGFGDTLNNLFRSHGLAAKVECYSSFLYFNLHGEDPLAPLLFYHLRDRGIHIQDGFPLFITTAHTDDDLAQVAAAFADSLDEMAAAGILAPAARQEAAIAAPRSVPLTESQIEIWLAAQMGDDASCAFNESVTLRLTGPLDDKALSAALARIVARHDALRARFTPTGEAMIIADDIAFCYPTTDATEAALAAYVEADARTPFDLVGGPPIRAHLFRLASDSHALVLTAHHIVCDGWSINVMIGELAEIYAALREGRDADLPALLPFSEYAVALAQRDPAERAPIEAYWLRQFDTPAQPIDMPTDRPRPAAKTYAGATRSLWIDAASYRAVKAAGARHGCTLFVTLLAAFETLMGRLAGVEELVVGVPTAGQSLIEDKVLVGHCVNFLPIRGHWTDGMSFADHLRTVGRQVLDAYEHQDITLGTIVRALSLPRLPNRLPLTELQFNLERLADQLHCGGLDIVVAPNAKAHVNFDIFWNVIESGDGLRIDCDYNTDLFDAASIDHWLECYAALLQAIAADATVPPGRIACIPPAERHRMVYDLNATAADYPRDRCVHALIEASAAARPDATSVLFRRTALSYRDLDERANQLAHHLQAVLGRAGGRVSVLMDRSPDMLIALLAVWKAGCAYVPLDPDHPIGRLKHILSDAEVSALLTDAARPDLPLGRAVAIIDVHAERTAIATRPATPPALSVNAEATAYLIYTSGSTGLPKGVEVSHRSLANLLCSVARRPGIAATDTLLAVTTISFDIAALELFVPLSVGATVAIAERRDVLDAHVLLARLNETAATMMQATPATWRMLLDAGFRSRPGLTMLCGGEVLPRTLADSLLDGGGTLWNMYGPTETTVWSSCARIVADDAPIAIGQPIANTQLHVLDRQLQPVPYGVIGELYIGGDGVAKGYFRREDLTKERFVADPFNPGHRLYRTGDVARRLCGGDIQVLGRADLQVKLRGHRIELGEVEAALSRRAGLAAAAVALRDDGQEHAVLVGYVVEYPGHKRSDEELRARLADELPDYMIPALWVRLDRLPISPNGKLDRAALPAPDRSSIQAQPFAPAQTPLEATLASIWAEVLGLERVGRDDELFRLGADSIQLFQIAARANRQQIRLSVRQLLTHRTVAALATALDAPAETTSADSDDEPSAAISLREFQRSRLSGTSG
jgi:amino acid adenylation domain-containing protein